MAGLLYTSYWCSGRTEPYETTGYPTYSGYANLAVWHEFDKAAGIDVGVAGIRGEQ